MDRLNSNTLFYSVVFLLLILVPDIALSADTGTVQDFTRHWAGFLC